MPMKIKVSSRMIMSMVFVDLAYGDVFTSPRTPGKYFMRVQTVEDSGDRSIFNALDLEQFVLIEFDGLESVTLMDSELSISPRE